MGEVGIHRVLQGVRCTLYAIHTTPTTAGLSWTHYMPFTQHPQQQDCPGHIICHSHNTHNSRTVLDTLYAIHTTPTTAGLSWTHYMPFTQHPQQQDCPGHIICHSHNTHNSRTVLDYRYGKLYDFTTSLKEAAVICQNDW